ncbi:hypothetical protein NOVOSPHI9U_10087 [Novosphingobium sp. 9U]|nr:hypothetical protein NOVOSPHI9U_10087 [Novosphingobium sp. 9U]
MPGKWFGSPPASFRLDEKRPATLGSATGRGFPPQENGDRSAADSAAETVMQVGVLGRDRIVLMRLDVIDDGFLQKLEVLVREYRAGAARFGRGGHGHVSYPVLACLSGAGERGERQQRPVRKFQVSAVKCHLANSR